MRNTDWASLLSLNVMKDRKKGTVKYGKKKKKQRKFNIQKYINNQQNAF